MFLSFLIVAISLAAEPGSRLLRFQQLWLKGSRSTGSIVASGTWDLPGLGMELVVHALASGFFTTESPGKPLTNTFILST